jgi:esterase FrsA
LSSLVDIINWRVDMVKKKLHNLNILGRNEISMDLAARLEGFIRLGIKKEQLMQVINEAATRGKLGTKEWAQSILIMADNFSEKAQDSERDWLEVSFWYFLGRFPHYFNNVMQKSYAKHKKAYLKANSLSRYPIEKVQISFGGRKVDTYLRKPIGENSSWPLVVIWGGIDIWKSDLQIHQIGNALLEKGVAVLAIDSPGTGDCTIPISSSAEKWFLAVLRVIKEREDINSTRIACYGLSFGGYWATKLAIQLPWLAGAVNVGGPIHHTFDTNWLKQLPDLTYSTLSYSCGFESTQNAFFAYCEELSLITQGYLPVKVNAPLLFINGAKDNLVKIAEIELLSAQGVNADTLIFSQDRHAASQNWSLHSQFSIEWLVGKLQ